MISCDYGTAAATSWSEGSCGFLLTLCWSLALACCSVCPQLSQTHGYSTCKHYAASKCKCCCPSRCPSVAHKVLAHAPTACMQASRFAIAPGNQYCCPSKTCVLNRLNAEHVVTCKCRTYGHLQMHQHAPARQEANAPLSALQPAPDSPSGGLPPKPPAQH